MSEGRDGDPERGDPERGAPPAARVVFCGERYPLPTDRSFGIGREADLSVDDNPFLHRRFLLIAADGPLWWLSNVGSALSATVADGRGLMQAWLSPGARLPIVFDRTVVWFTAGPTTYEVEVELDAPAFAPTPAGEPAGSGTTIGRVSLTPDQLLLLLALAEPALRRGGSRTGASLPSSAQAARRLGWTLTKFNRKLDNVCDKLTRLGVRGLHGDARNLAGARRGRLVEYAMTARLVTVDDLSVLYRPNGPDPGTDDGDG